MKKDTTLIAVVLDRSGSMGSCRADTIGGFNTFLAEQRKEPGEALITLTQFDDVYDVVYSKQNIKHTADLTEATYVPRGGTALLDAIGRTINDIGSQLKATSEAERPGKVIFVIITDGEENTSREYNRKRVFDMITHQREKYSWEFVYLGANQDAIAAATNLGVQASNAANYHASGIGTRSAFAATSKGMSSYRASPQAVCTNFYGGKDTIEEEEAETVDQSKIKTIIDPTLKTP